MSGVPNHLAAARLKLAKQRPYLSAVLWAMNPREAKGMMEAGAGGPIGVDRAWRLYYDPDRLAEWSVDEIAGVLYHECGHLLRDHDARYRALGVTPEDFPRWNIAGDAEINDDLVSEAGVVLPKPTLTPKAFGAKDGLLAEQYFQILEAKMAKAPKCECGSAAGGKDRDWEEPSEGKGADGAGVTRGEAELIRQKVAQDVKEHSRSRGDMPGWLSRWADERLDSKVDWRRLLASLIRRACGDVSGLVDYSYAHVSRRSGESPQVVLPALRQPTPRVAVVVDTSGSMGQGDLSVALSEIDAVLKACGQRQGISVLSCDAAVHTTQRVMRREAIRLEGGGGTDMRVGVAAAAELKPRPHAVILVTDGETPYPAHEMPMPLIVVLTRAHGQGAVPGWAKCVVAEAN